MVRVDEGSTTLGKIMIRGGRMYREHSPTPSQQFVHMIKLLSEDEPPIVSGGLMPIFRPSDSKKRSMAVVETNSNLKN
jgi:hypothetical protein